VILPIVAAVVIMWAAFLLPRSRRAGSMADSVQDFERTMALLARTRRHAQGRWLVAPRKGTPFLGPDGRSRARARERRRQVFVFLLECIGFTFLIGLVPPLRAMWAATGLFIALLGAYVWLLLWMKERSSRELAARRVRDANVPKHPRPVRERYVSEGALPKPAFNGLGAFHADELTNIVIRPARKVGVAGA
jgi:hypothetical protein